MSESNRNDIINLYGASNENSLPLHLFGNGMMSILLRGADIEFIRGPLPYSPSFCSLKLLPEYSKKYRIIHQRISVNAIKVMFVPENNIFGVDSINGMPGVELQIMMYIPSDYPIFICEYVATREIAFKIEYDEDVTITPFLKSHTLLRRRTLTKDGCSRYGAENRMYIVNSSNASYDKKTQTLTFGIGFGETAFCCGYNRTNGNFAERALRTTEFDDPYSPLPQNKLFLSAISFGSKRNLSYEEKVKNKIFWRAAEKYINFMNTMFDDFMVRRAGNNGLYLSLDGSPVMRSAAYVYMALFGLNSQRTETTLTLIRRLCSQFKYYPKVPEYLHCNTDLKLSRGSEIDFSSAGLYSAAMLISFSDHINSDGTISSDILNQALKMLLPISRKVLNGMLPFSEYDECFTTGVLPSKLRFSGSSVNTLVFIYAVFKSAKMTEKSLGKAAKLTDTLAIAARRARRAFRNNFIGNDGVYLNAPSREAGYKRPNVLYGFCDVCAFFEKPVYEGWLERNPSGLYVCPDCSAEPSPKEILPYEPDLRIVSPISAVLCAIVAPDILGDGEKEQFIEAYYDRWDNLDIKHRALLLIYSSLYMKDRFEVLLERMLNSLSSVKYNVSFDSLLLASALMSEALRFYMDGRDSIY